MKFKTFENIFAFVYNAVTTSKEKHGHEWN